MEHDGISAVEFENAVSRVNKLRKEMGRFVIGQANVIDQLIIAIMADGNALLESYPGMGKTLMVKTLAALTDLKFSRVQNTPDLLPADIIGTYIIEEEKAGKKFVFRQGPIFANLILADEINRATPKTQSAFLEAMQEKQVTVGNETFKLQEPFFVLATQNPIDLEGTYPLPEAQVDRFLLKILLTYPAREEEKKVMKLYSSNDSMRTVSKVMTRNDILRLQRITRMVPVSEDVTDYALDVVCKTRGHELIEFGASPRASIGLLVAGKANALISGRKFVSKKDIEEIAHPVLRHRIILSFQAEKDGKKPDDVVKELL